jgi:hypothetical protein
MKLRKAFFSVGSIASSPWVGLFFVYLLILQVPTIGELVREVSPKMETTVEMVMTGICLWLIIFFHFIQRKEAVKRVAKQSADLGRDCFIQAFKEEIQKICDEPPARPSSQVSFNAQELLSNLTALQGNRLLEQVDLTSVSKGER